MSDQAYEVLSKAIRAFEKSEFDSVAIVMVNGEGKFSYFDHAATNRLELIGALEILEAQVATPLIRKMASAATESDEPSAPEVK